jgi:hypothetical protein
MPESINGFYSEVADTKRASAPERRLGAGFPLECISQDAAHAAKSVCRQRQTLRRARSATVT